MSECSRNIEGGMALGITPEEAPGVQGEAFRLADRANWIGQACHLCDFA